MSENYRSSDFKDPWRFWNRHIRSVVLIPILTILLATMVAYVVVSKPPLVGLAIIGMSLGAMVMIMVFRKYDWGLYFLLLWGVFMHITGRVMHFPVPAGLLYDALIILTYFSLLASNRINKLKWNRFSNGLTVAFLFIIGFHLLQVVNPMGSKIAWAVSLRGLCLFILYVIVYHYFNTFWNIIKLTLLYLVVVLLVSLYGFYQEHIGLLDFEWSYIYAVPERYKLFFIGGRMRKFSFLSDPSSYGIYTACGALSCIVITLELKNYTHKIIFGTAGLIMLVAMTYSGTRTAFVMVVAGIAFYILMTIRTQRTMLIAVLAVISFVAILYGPFNNWQVNRIRSAFNPSEDASMAVRDVKRVKYQPFIRSHPLGGGPHTTAGNGSNYAKGHPLAGLDPDGGYLETALEQGIPGLALLLIFVTAIFIRGINSYFAASDPTIKTTILVYMVPFFAMALANYSQEVFKSKPMDLLFIVTIGLISRFPELIREKELAAPVRKTE